MFKKITSILAALLFTVSTSNSAEFINILTGGTSGVYYPLGSALTKIYVIFLNILILFKLFIFLNYRLKKKLN